MERELDTLAKRNPYSQGTQGYAGGSSDAVHMHESTNPSSRSTAARPTFWIPPDSTVDVPRTEHSILLNKSGFVGPIRSPVPGPTPPSPLTPNHLYQNNNTPPLPRPAAAQHQNSVEDETSRRERQFQSLFNSWSRRVAKLEGRQRKATLKSRNEEELSIVTDEFDRKLKAINIFYNEAIEALQMSLSESEGSESENSIDDTEDEGSVDSFDTASSENSFNTAPTPPPSENDEDHRAMQRRKASDRVKTDELVTALGQQLRPLVGLRRASSPRRNNRVTQQLPGQTPGRRGSDGPPPKLPSTPRPPPIPRPPAMSLFEQLASRQPRREDSVTPVSLC